MSRKNVENSKLISYICGFAASIILTLAAFSTVSLHIVSQRELIIGVILVLAFIQLGVQLFFFLHIGDESKPRWNLTFFTLTFSLILILVIGSLWIMSNLNYNMTPSQMNKYMLLDEGFQK